MTKPISIRMGAASLLAGLSLLLSGCFVTPGKFTSELVLVDEDTFTFTYEGEIFFLGLSQLAMMGGEEEFEAYCYDEDTSEARDCTQIEIDDQRANWEMDAPMRAANSKREAEQMAAMMGDLDPTDPEAAEGLRQKLLRQKGWERVEDKGDGVFDVRYSNTGTLSHDFMFPIIEGMPPTNPFVQIIVRDDNIIRINAPGFAAQSDASPMLAGLGGAALASVAASEEMENAPSGNPQDFPAMEGTFRIVTNKAIRANNTDEGPMAMPQGQALEWDISAQTKTAPTALIDLNS